MLVGVVLISGVIGGGAYGADPTLGVVLGVAHGDLLQRLPAAHPHRRARCAATGRSGRAGDHRASRSSAAAVGLVGGDLDLTPGPASLFWLALLGITSQSIGYLCISISLPRLPAVVTSIILLVQPVVTVALSMVLLGERPSPAQLLGVVCVIGGIAVATVPLARVRDGLRARRTAVTTAE